MSSHSISVIGCGWLGLPLAQLLVARDYHVFGSTTTKDKLSTLSDIEVTPVLLRLGEHSLECDNDMLWQANTFIIAIPLGVRKYGPVYHVNQIANLLKKLPSEVHLVYISSTSVYPSLSGKYDEAYILTEQNTGNQTLYNAERLVLERGHSAILRCGGLMGENRVSGRYFAGKQVSGAQQPVNYIHQKDAAALIECIVKSCITGIYNLVAPEHPTRKEVYKINSRIFDFEMPTFSDDGIERIIDGHSIAERLSYEFRYPDPRYFHG